jgi:hypothetical protein
VGGFARARIRTPGSIGTHPTSRDSPACWANRLFVFFTGVDRETRQRGPRIRRSQGAHWKGQVCKGVLTPTANNHLLIPRLALSGARRLRDAIASRMLAASSASSANTLSPKDLQRHHRGEAPHQHAHGLVGGLPSQHQRIVYGLPSSAHQPHRGGGLREPQATLLPPSRLQHLRQQFIRHIRPPAHRLPPPLCFQHRGNLLRDGEAAHRVSACHRPPVLVEVPALSTALAVWWVCLAAARGRRRRRYAQCHHHAPLSTLLL